MKNGSLMAAPSPPLLAPDHFATVLSHSPLALLGQKDRQDAAN